MTGATAATDRLRALLVEDEPADAELTLRALSGAGFAVEWSRVETEAAFVAELEGGWDIVIADYALPQFSGLRALELLRSSGHDLPFIVISGTIGEDVAVAAMVAGAGDYLMKGQLKRLGPAVRRELREAAVRRERRAALAALEEQRRFLADLIDYGSTIVFAKDTAGRYLLVNRLWEEVTGRAREHVIGYTDREVFPGDAGARFHADDTLVTTTGRSHEAEEQLETPSGHRHFLTVKFPLWSASRSVIGMCGIATEVTATRQAARELAVSEERYRMIFSLAANLIAAVDATGTIVDCNRQALQLLGIPRQQLIGMTISDIVHPGDLAAAMGLLAALARTGQAMTSEFRMRRSDGGIVHVDVAASWMDDVRDAAGRALWVLTDVTERKKNDERLAAQAAELRRTNDELLRFNRAMAGREMRLIDLKREVNALQARLGEPARYALSFLEDDAAARQTDPSAAKASGVRFPTTRQGP